MALKRIYEQGNRDSDTVSNEIQNNLSLHGYKYTDLKQKENEVETCVDMMSDRLLK